MSVIGTWKDDIRIDQEAVRAYVGGNSSDGAHADRDEDPSILRKK